MPQSLILFPSKQEFSYFFPKINPVVAETSAIMVTKDVDVSVGGVGIVDFSAGLTRCLYTKKYENVFLLGICGAYPHSGLEIGDIVRVEKEVLADMGIQNREGHFVPWNHITKEKIEYKCGSMEDVPLVLLQLPTVISGTVNCCTGTEYLGLHREALFQIQVENMEGASFFAICKSFGVSGHEFRAISNIAQDRDESKWNIPLALNNLKNKVLDILL